MSSNVGLVTPRGSGTSGYVQRNLSHLKPRDPATTSRPSPQDLDTLHHRQRQPDQEILEHDRKRAIEVKVFELRDRLEEEGYVVSSHQADHSDRSKLPEDELNAHANTNDASIDEDSIDDQCDALRTQLEAEQLRAGGGAPRTRDLKPHQVHEMARAKIEESERLRSALGISRDYEEGSHWKRQEERKVERRGGD